MSLKRRMVAVAIGSAAMVYLAIGTTAMAYDPGIGLRAGANDVIVFDGKALSGRCGGIIDPPLSGIENGAYQSKMFNTGRYYGNTDKSAINNMLPAFNTALATPFRVGQEGDGDILQATYPVGFDRNVDKSRQALNDRIHYGTPQTTPDRRRWIDRKQTAVLLGSTALSLGDHTWKVFPDNGEGRARIRI